MTVSVKLSSCRLMLAVIAYLALLGFTASAEVTPALLNLESCLSRVEKESVQVAQNVVSEARAKAALKEANQPRLPQLVAQENLAYAMDPEVLSPDSNKAVLRAELGTMPFLGSAWKLGNQKHLELEAASLAVVESVQDVQLLVKQLYFSILRDKEIAASLDSVEDEFDRLVATVTPKYQIGHAPQFDLVKVKSATYDLARTRDLTTSQRIGEKSQLNEILHLGSIDFELNPVLKVPPLVSVHEEDSKRYASNPTLAGLEKDIEAADASALVTSAQRVPSLSAAFEYGFQGLTPTTMVNQWTVLAQFRFTLFDWGLITSQEDQAQAVTILAQKKLEAEKEKIQADYDQTYALAQAHLRDHERLHELLPLLKRAATVAVDRYRVGGMGIIEVTDAINLWLQGLINERTAYYGYLSDLAKIERLSGKSIVRYE
jgi:outer membrane protein TolC